MKNKFLITLAAAILALTSCGGSKKPDESSSSEKDYNHPFDVELGEAPTYDEDSIQIHYYREDGKYTGWDLWLWEKGLDGAAYAFNGQDTWGVIASYPLSTWQDPVKNTLGFIVRKGGDAWSAKDLGGNDLFADLNDFEKDNKGVYHLYLISGTDPNIYTDADGTMKGVIQACYFQNMTTLYWHANMKVASYEIKEDGNVIYSNPKANADYDYLKIDFTPSFVKNYSMHAKFVNDEEMEIAVNKNVLYNDPAFSTDYNYEGDDLGAVVKDGKTTFKVWSPISTSIKVNVYDEGKETANEISRSFDMTLGEKGVFEKTVNEDLSGKYYTYTVTNSSFQNKEIVDPYAKSAGTNGVRGMIVDFSETNPEGWDALQPLEYDRKELVIYETHVADVTSSSTWTGTEANRKLFKGMYEKGTTYTKDGVTVKTGFDHIAELGVNAVQIIPLFDQANNEEQMNFNWGYNPLNYNVVEGGYSSDPSDGYVRIKEFKELVKAYHDEGIGIVMDVVYNHVAGASGSNFDVLMPGYYYRYNDDGSFSNGSGCGNETASDHYMMRKFMIDSCKFWAKEYKLLGFRFDLMGLHDIETMNQLTAAVKEINPYITIFGEPWTGGTTPLAAGKQAKQSNANQFQGYGQFNDQMRDALIKGGLNGKTALGWATQKGAAPRAADLKSIANGLKGITTGATNDPNKTTNYVTCHDNYTLYDRAIATNKFTANDDEELVKLNVLANSIVMTSQGTSFMLAGEEFLRTKGGNSNSYNASYKVNELDYALKIKHLDMIENYKKLIALKTNNEEFAYDEAGVNANVTVETSDNYIRLNISGEQSFVILYKNAYGEPVNLPEIGEGFTPYWSTINKDDFAGFDASTYKLGNYETLIFRK